MLVVGLLLPVNVSSFAPITFDTAELCVVTLNDKAWKRAKEVCNKLRYKGKPADIIKAFYGQENNAQTYQMIKFTPGSLLLNGFPSDVMQSHNLE